MNMLQDKSDETALDIFIQSKRLTENEWRKRLAFELCKAYQDGWIAALEKAKVSGLRTNDREAHMSIHQEKDHTEKCYEGGCPNVTRWKRCPVCKESQPTIDPANGLCQNGCGK